MDILDCPNGQEAEILIHHIQNIQRHFAPFTHVMLTLEIEAPLAIARQLWRSHVGATGGDAGYPGWSEASLRYIEADSFYMPEEFRAKLRA
jgi:thymidylate synthase ThyX